MQKCFPSDRICPVRLCRTPILAAITDAAETSTPDINAAYPIAWNIFGTDTKSAKAVFSGTADFKHSVRVEFGRGKKLALFRIGIVPIPGTIGRDLRSIESMQVGLAGIDSLGDLGGFGKVARRVRRGNREAAGGDIHLRPTRAGIEYHVGGIGQRVVVAGHESLATCSLR